MKSALAGTMERARSTFSTISLGQKVVIGLLLIGLLLGGFFFFRWITAPTQAPLFSNLASADASAIVDELNAGGVAYTLADGGQTIMVDKDAVYDLRLQMSGKGLPAGEDTGYALLEDQGITTPTAVGAATGLPAVEVVRLLIRRQWREGDVAALKATSRRRVSAYQCGRGGAPDHGSGLRPQG